LRGAFNGGGGGEDSPVKGNKVSSTERGFFLKKYHFLVFWNFK
jgi:hypothetical protein